jgi:hypothetical protein
MGKMMDKPTEWLITALKNPEGYDAHDLCGDAAKKIEELEGNNTNLFKQNMKQLKTICQFGGRIKELEQEVKDALAPSTHIINKKRQLAAFNGEDQG